LPGATGAAGPGAFRIKFDDPESGTYSYKNITTAELSLHLSCQSFGGSTSLDAYVESTVSAGLNFSRIDVLDNDYGSILAGTPIPQQSGFAIDPADGFFGHSLFTPRSALISTSSVSRSGGEFVYENANRAISVVFQAIANHNSGRCQFSGTATPTA